MAHDLPELPVWDSIPSDAGAAIATLKAAIKARIEANGHSVEAVIARAEAFIADEVNDIIATRARGEHVWPTVDFSDLRNGTVSESTRAAIKRRGCVVVRGNFERNTALGWDANIVDYVTTNRFFETYRGPGDDFFETVQSKPEIYPIYWSQAQMAARQHPNMATTQSFLNRLWTYETDGRQWFDPDHNLAYPDRIRRRPPGTSSAGLGTHLDAGTLDLWMSRGYQEAFASLYKGDFETYDPWSAAHRVEAAQFPGTTMCSAFRTFQGWTALSEMRHDQGVLHTIPIPKAFGYLLLRPLLDDVEPHDMCGVRVSRTFPVSEQFHSALLPASSAIPDVQPGDTVWWHCDLIHSVAPVADQQGWGNVMYIPTAPWCTKNEQYAQYVHDAFVAGGSPPDFPAEHYEASWNDRFSPAQLSPVGRAGMGLT